jgi:predicted kinase
MGCLVLVTGISGTGKTKLCREIVRNWNSNVVHLNKDKTLAEYAKMKGLTPDDILRDYEKERKFVYEMYYNITERELKKGRTVLLDNPHVKELLHCLEWKERVNGLCERTNSKLVFIKCFLPDLRGYRKRLEMRDLGRDREKLKTSETFRKFLEYEPLDFSAPKGSLAVDTSKKIDVPKVIEFIEESEGLKL